MHNQFNITPSGPRGGAAVYSDKAYELSNFSAKNLKQRVDAAKLIGKSRRIDKALDYAYRVYTTRGRAGRKIVVLLTAGRSASNSAPLGKIAESLRELGVQIFVINIGRTTRSAGFNALVDTPQDLIKVLPEALEYISEPISKKVREKKGKTFSELCFICFYQKTEDAIKV